MTRDRQVGPDEHTSGLVLRGAGRRRHRLHEARDLDAGCPQDRPGRPALLRVAQGAIQGGSYASRVIRRRLSGETTQPFRYSNHGDVAVIGRLAGVTDIPWLGPFGKQSGFFAWALWLLIHIAYLIGFANRVIVVTRWGWSFFTHGRGSRLITGEPLLPPIDTPEPPA